MPPLPVLDIEREIVQRGIPISAQNTYRRALAGSRPAAVKAACLECQGWEDGARQAVRDCPSVGCPLHAVRPFQKKAGSATAIDLDTDNDSDDAEQFEGSGGDKLNSPGRTITFDLVDVKVKILDHLQRHGESARGYIIFSSGIPESMWSEAIRSLLNEGSIERQGEKRSTTYRLADKAKA